MATPSARSTGLAAALSGGSLIAAEAALRVVADTDHWDCNSSSDLWVNALYLVSFVFIAPAVVGMQAQQATRAPRWSSPAAKVAAVGAVVTGVVNAAEHCLHLPLGFVFVAGALVTVAALAVFGIAVIKAQTLPQWMGYALLLGSAALQLLSQQGGVFAFGAVWLVTGVALLVRAPLRSAAGRPRRPVP